MHDVARSSQSGKHLHVRRHHWHPERHKGQAENIPLYIYCFPLNCALSVKLVTYRNETVTCSNDCFPWLLDEMYYISRHVIKWLRVWPKFTYSAKQPEEQKELRLTAYCQLQRISTRLYLQMKHSSVVFCMGLLELLQFGWQKILESGYLFLSPSLKLYLNRFCTLGTLKWYALEVPWHLHS